MGNFYSICYYILNFYFTDIKMANFSELIPSLSVIELKINVTDLDYIQLGEKFQPTKEVVAINSSFYHVAFEGYERFLSKPKATRRQKKSAETSPIKPARKRAGDGTVFNACIEFTIIVDDSNNTKIVRYFPRSGAIQIFGDIEPINILLRYLSESNLPEFVDVSLVGESKPLLLNYKFLIMLDRSKMINLYNLAIALESDDFVRDLAPFPIQYVKLDPSDVHYKIAILFSDNIRVHLWPKSGKVNIFGTKAELTASLIYDFICIIFTAKWEDFMRNMPIS
jgi:hypothetical protein